MKTMVPKYVQDAIKALDKAHASVNRNANIIADWAERQGADLCDFWNENRLDYPYEYNAEETLSNCAALTEML